jgi:hypothetical protein
VVVGAAVLGARWLPALIVTVALASPGAEPWIAPWLGNVARHEVTIDGIETDVYVRSNASPRAALVFVHGLSVTGRRHPDLMRLARLLAAAGPAVIVPHFEGLAAFRLSGREVADVGRALRHARTVAPTVGIAGFSFGAGPALVAAADADVELAASFGGYADLRNIIVFIATGAHEYAGGQYQHAPEPYNRWKLAALLVPFLDDDREMLTAITTARLANPATDTRAQERALGPEGHAVLALVRASTESDVRRRLAELPPRAQTALDALSPVAAVARLRARLVIAHGTDDPSIPFTESLRLAAASGRTQAVILGGFHHTGAAHVPRAAIDAWRLVVLVDNVIRLR